MLEAPEVVAEPFAPEDAVAFPTAPSIPSGVVDGNPLPPDEDTALLVRKGARLADDFIAGVLAEYVPCLLVPAKSPGVLC